MIPELIAIDLDGTLLPRSKELSPRAKAAVRSAASRNVAVVLATGKSYRLAARYADELGLAGPVIALDGSVVRSHPDRVELRSHRLPALRIREALALVEGLPLLPFWSDDGDRILIHDGLGPLVPFLSVYSDRIEAAALPGAGGGREPFFLGMLGPPAAATEGEARLGALAGNGLAVFSAEFFDRDLALLVVRPRASKGTALAGLAADLGVPRERVAAVGDWKNDEEMIRWAGTGVAMPDSDPAVLAAADVVLPHDSEQDGVARWLEELLAEPAEARQMA